MSELIDYNSVQSNTFIKIELENEDWLFSDCNENKTIDGDDYIGVGNLMGLTATSSELRVSSSEVTITITGIPNTAISEVMNADLKGSGVRIYRAFFDVNTGDLIDIETNPMLRYRGYINNFAFAESYDVESRDGNNTIQLMCASSVDQLNLKTSGRQTNPGSMQKYKPGDTSMDRVPNLENATFDFGAPK